MSRTSLRLAALSITLVAAALLAPASGLAATAPAPAAQQFGDVRCGLDPTNKRLCVTSSRTYPATIGWFGFLPPSTPCSGSPFAGYWDSNLAGACISTSTEAWKWTTTGFIRSSLSEGTKGYVHPYAAGWRWLYAKDASTGTSSWYAIQDSHLSLLWNA